MTLEPGARVHVMFAFLAIDENDIEGVIGVATSGGLQIPLVGADLERVDSLRPLAEKVAERSGVKVQLVRFNGREVLETFE